MEQIKIDICGICNNGVLSTEKECQVCGNRIQIEQHREPQVAFNILKPMDIPKHIRRV